VMMVGGSLISVAREPASEGVGPSTIVRSVMLCNSYCHGDSSAFRARWHSWHAVSRCCNRSITCTGRSGSIKQSGDAIVVGSADNPITPGSRLGEAERRRCHFAGAVLRRAVPIGGHVSRICILHYTGSGSSCRRPSYNQWLENQLCSLTAWCRNCWLLGPCVLMRG